MTQTQPQPPQTTPPPPQDDPLSHLHKMSTTAGLGSGDYVAVNGAAVATLLLGLASALVLLEEFLLIIPVACVIVAVIAWRQIKGSSGTQTGKALIAIGLVCALGFGGFVVVRQATEGMRTRADRAAIESLIKEMGEKTKAGDYDGLYARFSDRFKQGVPREQFDPHVASLRTSDRYGSLTSTTWNGLAEFQTDDNTGIRYVTANVNFNVEKADKPFSFMFTFSKRSGGQWQIDATQLFPPQPQQRRR